MKTYSLTGSRFLSDSKSITRNKTGVFGQSICKIDIKMNIWGLKEFFQFRVKAHSSVNSKEKSTYISGLAKDIFPIILKYYVNNLISFST